MSRKIVECVPNFSEGKDPAKIKQITAAIEAVQGVELLDVDPGRDTNRTVVTFVGAAEAVAEAAFQAIAKAAQVLDMSRHHGAHPRMGATDVCPFIPVEGVTMEDCAEIARQVGRRVGEELAIPVYFYEAAASTPERTNLANLREGEYEGLPKKLADPRWKPDCGPARFNPKTGATAVGAREFLIAYNVTLNTRDKSAATDIAFELRLKGRVARARPIRPSITGVKSSSIGKGISPAATATSPAKPSPRSRAIAARPTATSCASWRPRPARIFPTPPRSSAGKSAAPESSPSARRSAGTSISTAGRKSRST